jgi:hypothetical protein
MPFENPTWTSATRRQMHVALMVVVYAGLSCKPSAVSPGVARGDRSRGLF